MGRRFKRDGKGKKKSGGGALRQEDLDYLAKNTSMSKEDIQEYYKAINHDVDANDGDFWCTGTKSFCWRTNIGKPEGVIAFFVYTTIKCQN